jgi:hypothetical protein
MPMRMRRPPGTGGGRRKSQHTTRGRKPTGGAFGAGGSEPRYTVEQVREAIIKARGLVTEVARILGCGREVIYRGYLQVHEDLREALVEAREQTLDLAESKLFDAINSGQDWAIKYYLDAVGRRRGYGGGLLDFSPTPENGAIRQLTAEDLVAALLAAIRAGALIERMNEKQILLFAAVRKYGPERLGLPSEASALPAEVVSEVTVAKRGTKKRSSAGAPRRSRARKPRVRSEGSST